PFFLSENTRLGGEQIPPHTARCAADVPLILQIPPNKDACCRVKDKHGVLKWTHKHSDFSSLVQKRHLLPPLQSDGERDLRSAGERTEACFSSWWPFRDDQTEMWPRSQLLFLHFLSPSLSVSIMSSLLKTGYGIRGSLSRSFFNVSSCQQHTGPSDARLHSWTKSQSLCLN
ncbi:hypothetical protein KUCAC02_007116, partial [Chaenocephalus aceratus]